MGSVDGAPGPDDSAALSAPGDAGRIVGMAEPRWPSSLAPESLSPELPAEFYQPCVPGSPLNGPTTLEVTQPP